MSFLGLEGSSLQCALWNRKLIRMDRDQRRILVNMQDMTAIRAGLVRRGRY